MESLWSNLRLGGRHVLRRFNYIELKLRVHLRHFWWLSRLLYLSFLVFVVFAVINLFMEEDGHRYRRVGRTPTDGDLNQPYFTPAYNISVQAVCFGRNNISLEALMRETDPKLTLCTPKHVSGVFRDLGLWLDLVAGICASTMDGLEIRERVLAVLDARTTLPMELVKHVNAEWLLSLALCSQAYLPNRMPTTHRGDWYNGRTYATQEAIQHVRDKCFGLIDSGTITRLDNFEFDLVYNLPLMQSTFTNLDIASDMAKIALVLAGVASPASRRKVYTGRWVSHVEELRTRLRKSLETASVQQVEHVKSYFLSHEGVVSAVLLKEAGTMLGFGDFITTDNVTLMRANEPLPRMLYYSRHLKLLPLWSGNEPPPLSKTSAPVAVVVPFHDGELAKIQYFFGLIPKTFEPMKSESEEEADVAVPIILALNDDFDSASGKMLRNSILEMWNKLGLQQTLYLLSLRQPQETNHYDGAAMSFYQLQAFMGGYFPAMQIMETDVIPIQTDWMRRLALEAKGACVDWWMRGSSQQCSPLLNYRTDIRIDFHINGNSLYATGCLDFDNYIRRVQSFYVPHGSVGGQCDLVGGCETGKMFEGGYDHVLYRYKQDPLTYHYSRNILSKFQYTANILNYCEDPYNSSELLMMNSDAFLVHSKFPLFSFEHRKLLELFHSILYRQPLQHEMEFYWPKLYFKVFEVSDVIDMLCALTEYQELVTIGMISSSCVKDSIVYGPRKIETHPLRTNMVAPRLNARVERMSKKELQCVMPILGPLRMVIRSSTRKNICAEFGDCVSSSSSSTSSSSSSSSLDTFNFTFCGEDVDECESLLSNDGLKMVFIVSMEMILKSHTGSKEDAFAWRQSLSLLGDDERVTIVSSDVFAREYLQYVTGIQPHHIPSWCGATMFNHRAIFQGGHTSRVEPTYLPARHEVLIFVPDNVTDMHEKLIKKVSKELEQRSHRTLTAVNMLQMYHQGTSDFKLCRHPAIVVVPSMLSVPLEVVSFYRLGIPLFLPSAKLYFKWYEKQFKEIFPLLKNYHEWVNHVLDIASWPGVTQFDDEAQLVVELTTTNFQQSSVQMQRHTTQQREVIITEWTAVLQVISKRLPILERSHRKHVVA